MKKPAKSFLFEVKETNDAAGTFVGMLSVYNVQDLGNDVVKPGAFTKTIAENPRVPMLWQHKSDEPIGFLELIDTKDGLQVKGTFDLDVRRGAEAYSLVKKGIIKGLSIGYDAIKKSVEKGIRNLLEIKLWEGSVVTFPMLPVAQISDVKSTQEKDFDAALAEAQTWMMHSMMVGSLDDSLCEIRWDSQASRDDRMTMASDTIEQFKASYLGYLPNYFDLTGAKSAEPTVRAQTEAQKARTRELITHLQALLGDEPDTSAEAVEDPDKAARSSIEPELHSLAQTFDEQLKALIAA